MVPENNEKSALEREISRSREREKGIPRQSLDTGKSGARLKSGTAMDSGGDESL